MTIDPTIINAIRDQFLGGVSSSPVPTVYCMAGIPGAGKSTFVDAALQRGEFPRQAFLLDPDRVMNAIPQYRDDLQTLGAIEAFSKWELPARHLAYAMLDDAAHIKGDIIKDMGCARMENYDKLKALKQSGYRVQMYYIDCPVPDALERIEHRPRHTPEQLVRDRASGLVELLPLYQNLADEFTVLPFRNAPAL